MNFCVKKTLTHTVYVFSLKLFALLTFFNHSDNKEYFNGESDGNSMELTESNSLEEDLQKAISTAERRKVCIFL